ncbi:MAG: hypothetical protein AB7I30_06650 [Isosphaeraceae bacterium]
MRRSLILAATAFLFIAMPAAAPAGVVLSVYQSGLDVEALGFGTVNTAGLTLLPGGVSNNNVGVQPSTGFLIIGGTSGLTFSGFSGPSGFGPSGTFTPATSFSGDTFGIFVNNGRMKLPAGYVSGSPLQSTATWLNTTLASLGLTDGTYVYTWGTGSNADSLTIVVGGTAAVPEPSPIVLSAVGVAVPLGRRLLKRRGERI